MSGRRKLVKWLVVLGALHGVIACAGFLAPNESIAQDREHPFAPPSKLHIRDAHGHLHARPFFYPFRIRTSLAGLYEYEEDTARTISLKFFMGGAHYKLFGLIPCSLHLLGADNERIYLFGTDGYGRDQFARILYGGQVSLLAGWLGAGITLFLGLAIGSVAGYFGGWRDEILMRLAELFIALPWIYLLLGLRAFLPLAVSPVEAFLLIVVVSGMLGWARPARLVRGVVLSAKERDFVRAARGFGASDKYIFRRHVLPETSSVLLTQAATLVPQFVLAEMTLSFLGLGLPEPVASWGNLLANLQQYSVLVSYWWMYLPALAIVPFFTAYLGLASALHEWADFSKIEI